MQKSLCLHVCANKNGLVRHVIILRTLLDAHGPKEVSENKQYGLASQSQHLHSLTCTFYTILIPFQEPFTSETHQNTVKIACKRVKTLTLRGAKKIFVRL